MLKKQYVLFKEVMIWNFFYTHICTIRHLTMLQTRRPRSTSNAKRTTTDEHGTEKRSNTWAHLGGTSSWPVDRWHCVATCNILEGLCSSVVCSWQESSRYSRWSAAVDERVSRWSGVSDTWSVLRWTGRICGNSHLDLSPLARGSP